VSASSRSPEEFHTIRKPAIRTNRTHILVSLISRGNKRLGVKEKEETADPDSLLNMVALTELDSNQGREDLQRLHTLYESLDQPGNPDHENFFSGLV
jgi:hypothetical protein